jgi:hypothetical protein
MNMPAWSYSALTSFETCPRKHHETRVTKTYTEPEGAQLLIGIAAHKVLELRAAAGTPIPKTLQVTDAQGNTLQSATAGWPEMMDKLLARPGDVHAERQIALDDRLCETGWLDKNVWVRGVIDLALVDGEKALAIDYKTGRRKPDSDQLMLFAALMFHVWPKLEKVVTGFLWLKTQQIDKETYTRSDLSRIWDTFIPRVNRYQDAFVANTWPPRPSGLCKAWCPVQTCEYNGRKAL